MRYLMRQKIFSLRSDFTIKDEHERDAFRVRGKLLSLGNKLTFADLQERELAFIKQRLFVLRPTYEIYRDGRLAATVRKHLLTFLRDKFTIETSSGAHPEVTGNIWDHEYAFQRGGRTVATVSKAWFSFTDTYGVEIAPDEDDILILAATVVIDMISHGRHE